MIPESCKSALIHDPKTLLAFIPVLLLEYWIGKTKMTEASSIVDWLLMQLKTIGLVIIVVMVLSVFVLISKIKGEKNG